jgi:hypothetical protein
MKRRTFLQTAGAAALVTGLGPKVAQGFVPAHNWDKHDFGSGPPVRDRLYQGPFPQYAPEEVLPGSSVVMTTAPSGEIVPNFGMGLTVYVSGDYWPPRTSGDSIEKYCEDLISLPFAQKIYIRLNWRDIQKQPGKLEFPEGWKITFDLAKRYGKRVGFRIMLENPDHPEPGMPEFLMSKVPYVDLKGQWERRTLNSRHKKLNQMPRYDHPDYQAAFRELNALLAEEMDGNPLVEYADTMMYGFWGEGHTWPYEGNPFPDSVTAEETWMRMMETQLEFWTRTPLVTNTQPDFSRVGNSEMLDRTIRSHNWLRTDTIFIENEQIEALSNRPAWIAAVCESGMAGDPAKLFITDADGMTRPENIIVHVMDVGANYWSLWNFHNISAKNLLVYYEKFPQHIDRLARCIGYRIRPSWIWSFEKDGFPGLVLGLVNDGIACVPGVLRVTVFSDDGAVNVGGCIDPGYPMTHGVRQAMLMLPRGRDWKGLKLKAELEVKGLRYPVTWACRQKLNTDGSLTLRSTEGI